MDLKTAEETAAVEGFIAAAAGAQKVTITQARPLTGGAIQENWLLSLEIEGGPEAGRREVVLRTDAASGVAVSLSRAQEFALLKAAEAAGVTVPQPLWLCRDASVLGKDFYVMERARGTALGPRIVKDETLGGDREVLVERLGRELARIHTIRPPRDNLDFLEMPEGHPAQHAIGRYRSYLDALGAPRPALEWGLRWGERHLPSAGEIVLVHQDFRTGNYMVDERGLTAVLDWEFCAWGDPMSDLGWFCAACWRFGRLEREAGGLGTRAAFYRGYEAESGRAVDDASVRYWEVLAHIRWAVIALQQGARHISGAEPSLDLALTGRRVAELEHAILNLTAPQAWRSA